MGMHVSLQLVLLFIVCFQLVPESQGEGVVAVRGEVKPIRCSNRFKQVDCGFGWACLNHTCARCKQDADCASDNLVCRYDASVKENVCIQKPLFPFVTRDWICTWTAPLVAMLASATGLGGGPLFVPLLILVLGLSPFTAIPLSKAMVLGVALANLVLNLGTPHPNHHASTLIDFGAALLLEPATLLGTVIGVFLNTWLPTWIIVILISLTTGTITIRTAFKARRFWLAEKAAAKLRHQSGASTTPRHTVVQAAEGEIVCGGGDGASGDEHEPLLPAKTSPRRRRRRRSARLIPLPLVWPLCALWALLLLITLAKGGRDTSSVFGVAKCSVAYWLLYAAPVVVVVVTTLGIGYYLVSRPFLLGRERTSSSRLKGKEVWGAHDDAGSDVGSASGTPPTTTSGLPDLWVSEPESMEDLTTVCPPTTSPKHIQWTPTRVLLYPSFAILAGVIAGLMGLGGGMVKGPLLLELGVDAASAAATSLWMILFTAGSTTVQFAVLGRVPWDYGLWYATIAFVSALVGKLALNAVVQRSGNASIIVIGFVLFLGTSCIVLTYLGTLEAVSNWRHGNAFSLNNLCGPVIG